MKTIKSLLLVAGMMAMSTTNASVVTWGDYWTYGNAVETGSFITDGYIEFDGFYAEELVSITGSARLDRLSYDGVPTGDITYALDIRLNDIWTTIWSFESPDGSGNIDISLSEIQPASCWYCETPAEAGLDSTSGIDFGGGIVSGMRVSVDNPFSWAFHDFTDTAFQFGVSQVSVPAPGTGILFLGALIAVFCVRKSKSALKR